jgi:hypothetical protein
MACGAPGDGEQAPRRRSLGGTAEKTITGYSLSHGTCPNPDQMTSHGKSTNILENAVISRIGGLSFTKPESPESGEKKKAQDGVKEEKNLIPPM